MKIHNFVRDHRIHTVSHGKHFAAGWVNMFCPFCHGRDHLGYSLDDNFFFCWKCGYHSEVSVVRETINSTWAEAYKLLAVYGGKTRDKKKRVVYSQKCKLPVSTTALSTIHRQYLIRRGFDPEQLEQEWDLQGTSNTGDYKFRIIIPIYYDHQLVSYQGRSISDNAELKYKACAKKDEVINHKNILYGLDKCKNKQNVVIVEGVADAWRLGPGAVATFGVAYKSTQIALMRQFKNRFILFDNDKAGQKAASALYNRLVAFPGYTEIIELSDGDPADISQKDADSLMRELVGI